MTDEPAARAATRELLHVVLVHPQIHWNTGNTGRSCLAFGAHLHLVEPLGFSLDAREVRRAGLDYWEHVPRTVHASWDACASALADLGPPWFLSAEAERSLYDAPLERSCVFVLGCESSGLPEVLRRENEARLIAVPQDRRRVRSLNQSTTAALALAEYRRRFGPPGSE